MKRIGIVTRTLVRGAALFLGAMAILNTSPADALSNREYGLGVGARAMGMGGAFVSVADDLSASYWNPAGLVQISRVEVGIMAGSLFNDKTRNAHLAVHYPTRDDIHLAIGLDHLFFPETGGAYEGNYSASVAIPLTKDRAFSAGLNVHYLRSDLRVPGGRSRGAGADLGFLFAKKIRGGNEVRAGLAVNDIATSARFEGGAEQELPRLFTPGLSFVYRQDTVLSLNTSFVGNAPLAAEDDIRFRAGAEHWLFERRLGFRAGYVGSTTLSGMFSMGTSYHARQWALDYAFLAHPEELGNSHRLSATWMLGHPREEDAYQPRMLRTLVSDGVVHLEWEMPEIRPDAAPVDGYWVYLKVEGTDEFRRVRTDLMPERECVLRGAQNGKAHRLYVTAVVQGREQTPSRYITATPHPMSPEGRRLYETGLAQFEAGNISASLYAARRAEELEPDDWSVKELLRKLETAMNKGWVEPREAP